MKQERVDIAIVGSGIGGLYAGAFLSQAGYNVLVTEKLPVIGGRCSTLDHKGFKLFTGVACIEKGGMVEAAFGELGAEFNIRMPDPQLVYRIQGKDHVLAQKGRLKTLVSLACDDKNEADKVLSVLYRALTWQEPADSISLREWIEQYTKNPIVAGLFYAYVSDEREISAGESIRSMKSAGNYSYGYPVGGCIALMESLSKVIRNKGGQVWTRSRTQRILVKDGVACGIVVRRDGHDTQVNAGAVISNAGPQSTVQLAGEDQFDKGHLKDAKSLPFSPYIQFHIISDRPLIDTPALVFIPDALRMYYMACPTLTCPELAPKGKHMLIAGGAARRTLGLIDFKKELQLSVEDLKENLPGLDRYGQILHAGCFDRGWPASRSVQGAAMPRKTSVEKLYEVGDGVVPSAGAGGHIGCLRAARDVVADIRTRLKPGGYS